MIVEFENPNDLNPWEAPVESLVNEYSHHAVGGPESASISIRGLPDDLADMTNRLRYKVNIRNEDGLLVWWGYLFGAEIRFGERQINVSLGRVANRVAVAYAKLDPGQETSSVRETTSFAQDAFSIMRYGTKERLISYSDATLEVAEAVRDQALAKYSLPRREVSSGISEGGSLSGLLKCKGWFNTLGWELYSQASGLEAYTDIGTGTEPMGDTSSQQVAQSFQISVAGEWFSSSASFRARAEGSPADNCVVELCSDSAGAPGTVLASATIPGTSFDDQLQWMGVELSPRVQLAPSTTYWLKIRRSGSQDASNHYIIDVNEALGYTNGAFKIYTGSWVNRSPNADMLFKVSGVRETSQQIAEMLTAEGQFLTGYTVSDASGVYSNPYRDGDNNVLYYLRELLAAGTSNGRRYLCRIDENRHLWIYEEPDPVLWGVAWRVDEYDNWYNAANVPLPKNTCPVGNWYSVDALPETLGSAEVSDSGVYFIERSTYIPKSDRLVVDPPESEEFVESVDFI
jgi:hypothetical protein